MHAGVHVRWLLPLGLSALASNSHSNAAALTSSGPPVRVADPRTDVAALLQLNAEPSMASMMAADKLAAVRKANGRVRGDPFPETSINFGDAQYISYLRIGRQILAGMLDTGSFELVVFGADCRSCGVAAHYNPSLSSTFRSGRLVSQQAYGSGSCYSTASADVLQMGPFSEVRQSFWTVQQANMPTLADSAFEALIGLGPPEAPSTDAWKAVTAVISNVTAYFDMGEKAPSWLMKQVEKRLEIADEMSVKSTLLNNFDVSAFSVCLGSTSRSNGIVVWNDAAFLAQPDVFSHVPVLGNHTWSANLTNLTLTMGGQNASGGANESSELGCPPDTGCSAILDTGMSLIAAPRGVIARLRQEMLRLEPDCSNIDVLPDLAFELGGQQFSLPPEAYVGKVEGVIPDHLASLINWNHSATCQLLLIESAAVTRNGPLWILGMPFFRKYYATFSLGASVAERTVHIAPHGDECTLPETKPSLLLTGLDPHAIEVERIRLPRAASAPGLPKLRRA
mmetsp:Transcript_66760/g.177828  ORF Transcript_66760/g.177828 Transcript_66760/m.177828 type:complete len:509 (-) Transcript_66760:38-1564(-)